MRLTEFKDEYAKLINMVYGELSNQQKQTVYAMESYNDGADALTACDIYASSPTSGDALAPDFVDDQLRNTFEYDDTTTIVEQ